MTDGEYNIVYLPEVDVNNSLAEFKKVLIRDNSGDTEYLELYLLLNPVKNGDGSYTHKWYKYIENEKRYEEYTGEIPNIEINEDGSAINYAIETACFNAWLEEKGIDGDSIKSQKEQTIINNINLNLDLAIANYSANSEIDYTLPELTETDWEQALSNISMITFVQGMKTGLKIYNNYCIVTSYENNEFVNEDSLYYLEDEDLYYHRYGCNEAQQRIGEAGAYKNTEFKLKSYTDINGEIRYYYKHTNGAYGIRECFNCIVNKNNYTKLSDYDLEHISWKQIRDTALAREKYIQMCRTRLTDANAIVNESTNSGEDNEPIIPDVPVPPIEPDNPDEPTIPVVVCSHNFDKVYTSNGLSGHTIRCSNCGEVIGSETHDLYYEQITGGSRLNPQYYHQRKCRLCNYTAGRATVCTLEWRYNDSQHWQVCATCGRETNKVGHNFSSRICLTCRI